MGKARPRRPEKTTRGVIAAEYHVRFESGGRTLEQFYVLEDLTIWCWLVGDLPVAVTGRPDRSFPHGWDQFLALGEPIRPRRTSERP
jgi:hypothetical protein